MNKLDQHARNGKPGYRRLLSAPSIMTMRRFAFFCSAPEFDLHRSLALMVLLDFGRVAWSVSRLCCWSLWAV